MAAIYMVKSVDVRIVRRLHALRTCANVRLRVVSQCRSERRWPEGRVETTQMALDGRECKLLGIVVYPFGSEGCARTAKTQLAAWKLYYFASRLSIVLTSSFPLTQSLA